jgi:hypothetical protein
MTVVRNILGVFDGPAALASALRALNAGKVPVAEVYTPFQVEEILDLFHEGRSPVRYATFTGAVAGLLVGMGLALLTSAVWELVTGGKPVYSIVPFLVVGFELTILLGALATLAGLLLFARLPYRKFPAPGYRPEFSNDRFGVWVACPGDRLDEVRVLLKKSGALEIQDIDSETAA